MAQKSGNNVKPPVHEEKNISGNTDTPTNREELNQQHHGEVQKAPQEERNIGQHNGTGRPPLMKK